MSNSMPPNGVGRSPGHTPIKLSFIDRVVGTESGVLRGPKFRRYERLVWIDLTAGDGAPDLPEGEDWRRSCSPGLLAYHASKSPKPVCVLLQENRKTAFKPLLDSLTRHLPDLGFREVAEGSWRHPTKGHRLLARLEDSQNLDVSWVQPTDAVLVLNDPNSVATWALREGLDQEIQTRTPMLRVVSALGWNAAAVKKNPRDTRVGWFDLVQNQGVNLPGNKDLLLVALDRDAHQWSYTVTTPVFGDWRQRTEADALRSVKALERTASTAWFSDRVKFQDLASRLYLTKKERGES